MDACEVVRLFVNKVVVPAEPRRRGNPGYGRLKALRVLVYSRLKGLENDTRMQGKCLRPCYSGRRCAGSLRSC